MLDNHHLCLVLNHFYCSQCEPCIYYKVIPHPSQPLAPGNHCHTYCLWPYLLRVFNLNRTIQYGVFVVNFFHIVQYLQGSSTL